MPKKTKPTPQTPAPSPQMLAVHARRERAQILLGRAGVIGVNAAVYRMDQPGAWWEQVVEQAIFEGGVLVIDLEAEKPMLVLPLAVAEAWLEMEKPTPKGG